MTLARLVPKATLAELHPPKTAYTVRSSLDRTRWVFWDASSLEAVTGFPLPVAGSMPLICHRGAATEEALQIMRLAGLEPPGDLRLYESEAEAVALMQALAAEGMKLAYTYPPPAGADDPARLLVPLKLYGALNDKASLEEFISPEHLAPRRFLTLEAARHEPPLEKPIYLKVSHAGACGGGVDVRYCGSVADWHGALDEFGARQSFGLRLVLEEALDIPTCWCLSMAIRDDDVIHLGAAIQLFDKPGLQIGSLIDPSRPPSEAAIELALDAGAKARQRGYRGLAGADIGQDTQGRLFVFDLNFRINSSTPQVLLHDAATARVGARVSRSFNASVPHRLASLLERIAPYVAEGRFVPVRLYDPGAGGNSRITGMVVEHSAEAAERFVSDLAGVLADRSR